MSLARELRIRDGRLVQRPRLSLERATSQPARDRFKLAEELALAELVGSRAFVLRLVLELAPGASCRIRVGSAQSHVDFELSGDSLQVDRSASRYAIAARRSVTLPPVAARVVEIYHDRSITECFLDGGAVAFTMRSYLDVDAAGVSLSVQGEVELGELSAHRFD